MRIAMRIRQVRLQHMLTLDELAIKAQLSNSLLANIESGQVIPSVEIFDRLAEAMDVGVEGLFHDGLNSAVTPWLTPRLSLQQLFDEPSRTTYGEISSLLNPRVIFAAIQRLREWAPHGNQRGAGNASPISKANSKLQPRDHAKDKAEDVIPKV